MVGASSGRLLDAYRCAYDDLADMLVSHGKLQDESKLPNLNVGKVVEQGAASEYGDNLDLDHEAKTIAFKLAIALEDGPCSRHRTETIIAVAFVIVFSLTKYNDRRNFSTVANAVGVSRQAIIAAFQTAYDDLAELNVPERPYESA